MKRKRIETMSAIGWDCNHTAPVFYTDKITPIQVLRAKAKPETFVHNLGHHLSRKLKRNIRIDAVYLSRDEVLFQRSQGE